MPFLPLDGVARRRRHDVDRRAVLRRDPRGARRRRRQGRAAGHGRRRPRLGPAVLERRERDVPLGERGEALARGVALRDERGREAVLRLADRADVFLQSLRPGLAERLGLGADALRARNPRLVYCSVGAYGARRAARGGAGLRRAHAGRGRAHQHDRRAGPARRARRLVAHRHGHRDVVGARASSPRCSSASAPARARSSTRRCTRRRSATSATTSSATSPTARSRPAREPSSRWSRRTRSSRRATASSWSPAGTTACSRCSASALELPGARRRRALPDEPGPRPQPRGARRARLRAAPGARHGRVARAADVPRASRPRPSPTSRTSSRRSRRRRSASSSRSSTPTIPDLRLPALPLSFDGERATHASPRPPSASTRPRSSRRSATRRTRSRRSPPPASFVRNSLERIELRGATRREDRGDDPDDDGRDHEHDHLRRREREGDEVDARR